MYGPRMDRISDQMAELKADLRKLIEKLPPRSDDEGDTNA
jgi:hypothetical protein